MTEQQLRAMLLLAAVGRLKQPYHWESADCSAYVDAMLEAVGIDPAPIIAAGAKLSTSGKRSDCLMRGLPLPVSDYTPQPGDIAFYGDATSAHHVVLLLGTNGTAIIGANGGGPPIAAETEAEYVARMARLSAGVRIEDWRKGGWHYRNDLIGFRRLPFEQSKLQSSNP